MKTSFKTLLLLILVLNLISLGSCKDEGSSTANDVGLEALFQVDLNGAKAIFSIQTENSSGTHRSLSGSESLLKADAEGIISQAFGGENIDFERVEFIHAAEDGSVYICYGNHFSVFEESGTSYEIQFLQIKPDNSIKLISDFVTYIIKPVFSDNKIYFSEDDSINVININTGNQEVFAESLGFRINKIAVNSLGQLLVAGYTGDSDDGDLIIQYFTANGEGNRIHRFTIEDETVTDHIRMSIITDIADKFIIKTNNINSNENYRASILTITDSLNYEEYVQWGRYIGTGDTASFLHEVGGAAATDEESALIIKETDGVYHWSDNILTSSIIDEVKLNSLMSSYTINSYSIKPDTLATLQESTNFDSLVTELINNGETAFFNNYFNGNIIEINGIDPGSIPDILGRLSQFVQYSDGIYGLSLESSGLGIVKVLNGSFENDIEKVNFDDRSVTTGAPQYDAISLTAQDYQLRGENLYFYYDRLSEISGYTPVFHFGRVNIKTGITEYFDEWLNMEIELESFAVSDDEKEYYFSGTKLSDGQPFSGMVDLTDRSMTEMDTEAVLEMIETF